MSGAKVAPRIPALCREGPVCSQLALLWCSSILCSVSRPGCTLEPFMGKFSSHFFFFSLAIPQFELLSHVISLRLSSGHSGPVLTLRTNDAAHTSLSNPCSLVADVNIWAISPLEIVVRRLFCGFFFFPSRLCCPLRFQNSPRDPPVRGFPTVWKLLLHDSLPRMCLCP